MLLLLAMPTSFSGILLEIDPKVIKALIIHSEHENACFISQSDNDTEKRSSFFSYFGTQSKPKHFYFSETASEEAGQGEAIKVSARYASLHCLYRLLLHPGPGFERCLEIPLKQWSKIWINHSAFYVLSLLSRPAQYHCVTYFSLLIISSLSFFVHGIHQKLLDSDKCLASRFDISRKPNHSSHRIPPIPFFLRTLCDFDYLTWDLRLAIMTARWDLTANFSFSNSTNYKLVFRA